MFKRKM